MVRLDDSTTMTRDVCQEIAKSSWISSAQPVCNLPPPWMNQWDTQLTFPQRLRLAWHDIQTSNWPTSGHWSICGSLGMCRIQSAFTNYARLFRLKARNNPTSRLLFWSKSNQRCASSVCWIASFWKTFKIPVLIWQIWGGRHNKTTRLYKINK